MLKVEGLHVAYGDTDAVHDLDLVVGSERIVAIIGSNGAGKSTTLQAIAGVHPVRAGRVWLDGEDVAGQPAHQIARRGVAFVPAERNLFTAMTVAENLALGAHPHRPAPRRLELVLELFPRLAERRRQRAATMSGGEQQMLAIARALMSHPRLLILDEPSTGLAPGLAAETYRALAGLHEAQRLAVLVAEQQVPLVLGLADHAYVLEQGRVQLAGTAVQLRDHPAVQRAYLGVG
ncbi:MAG: ABC transporter ATP-binding protein [Actinomycetota bacterium]